MLLMLGVVGIVGAWAVLVVGTAMYLGTRTVSLRDRIVRNKW